jgi:adenylate cyclase
MAKQMSLFPNIRYGTEGYPEKVARRLRAANIAAWIGFCGSAVFGVWRFLDGTAHWKYVSLVALGYALVPLLHRFGALAAPLALVAIFYTWGFWISSHGGTESGTNFLYLAAAPFGILLIGAEHVFLSIVIGAVAAGLIIILHLVVPRDATGVHASSVAFIVNVLGISTALYGIVFYAMRQFARAEERAEREHDRSQSLLVNILPPQVAERLKERSDKIIADAYPEASVLFADMGGFTARTSDTAPEELVRFLNRVYTQLDSLVERHDLEKIKTTGDAYMVVSGVPEPVPDHAAALADLAIDMRDALVGLVDPKGRPVPVRIGIASGPVVAGVVGTRKFFYDVWGDAVNTASRMESTGESGKIQVAPATRKLLVGQFELVERGVIEVRGKGPMQTWFLIGRTPGGSKPSVD